MGLGMASSLARAGFDVCGYDPVAERRAALSEGARPADSLREAAAGAGVLLVVVVNATQTRAVLDEALPSLAPGAVVIASATMSPINAQELARITEATGRQYLDAPISGGSRRAAEGALTVFASGSDAAFAAAATALDCMASKVYRLGTEPGQGAAYKIVNQLLAGVHIAAASEAIVFAKGLGLDPAKVYEVITASAGNSWMFEDRIPHYLERNFTPRSAVSIFTKDLGIVSDIARSARLVTPLASTALQMFLMTAATGMGRDDDSSVARLYERLLPEAEPTTRE